MSDFEISSTKEYLKYVFSLEEKRELADKLALAVMNKDEAEASLKSAQTQIKSKIALHEAELVSFAEKLRSGFEMRNIECEVIKDFEHGIIMITRKDTGEIVTERKMTIEERQKKLPLEQAA